MIYIMILYNLKYNRSALLIVPTINLVEQMYSDFKDYGIDKYMKNEGIDININRIYGGMVKDFNSDIIISTWQSLNNKDDINSLVNANISMTIIDEAHLGKEGKKLADIVQSLTECEYKIGTTGSVPSNSLERQQMKAITGNIIKIISSRELIDMGFATDIKISAIYIKRKDIKLCRDFNKMKYTDQEKYIYNDTVKLNFVTKMALNVNKYGNSLLFFKNIKFGKALFEELKKHTDKVYYIDGSINGLEREDIRKSLESSDNGVITVASYKTFGTGINIKNISVGILAQNAGKSSTTLIQSIGRFLRQSSGKNVAYLWDLVDDFSIRNRNNKIKRNYAYKHFIERLNIYREEEHIITEKSIFI